jgi:hypothetical protein
MTTDGAPETAPGSPVETGGRVVAVVRDLFFVARIRETARLAGVPLEFARTPEALETALGGPVRFALVDLTGGFEYPRVFAALAAHGVPVLAFTTHALARETRPWHERCAQVVTKETLTRELGTLLREGIARRGSVAVDERAAGGEAITTSAGSDG